jgi:peptidoglycan/xylan/chitin deacetylase (PgdA/CDA1 family)
MLKPVIFSLLVIAALAAPQNDYTYDLDAAASCDSTQCVLPDCRCSGTSPPTDIDIEQIPQFVFLTFDDAIQQGNYEIYSRLFDNLTNPDGCPVSATFFMSHDYTDYSKVHDLYVKHHEIALHSITHQALTDYWRDITIEQLNREFGDEKVIITTFANIPPESIQGMRIPYLQLSGDNTFQVGKDLNLTYDCSWPTQTFRKPGLWPYTLDYKSNQDCPIGPCPADSIPGMWVVPMIDWTDQANIVCSMVDACVNIPDNTDDLLQWFIDNFNVQYLGNKAPFGFFVHAAYFNANPIHLEAYIKFVDYLQGLNDVFLVTPSTAIKWIKNPVPIGGGGWPECTQIDDLGCDVKVCQLQKDEEVRYMTLCGECPEVYPWLGNPLGIAEN